MEFTYGQGRFIESSKDIEGQIVLSEHKLFLKGKEGDLTQTYIPLEKIERVRKIRNTLEVHVRPTLTIQYVARIQGENKSISELTNDIVSRRGLKKVFLKKEWIERP